MAGIALVIAGLLIARRSALGVWLYLLLFAATVAWALWEVGLDAWALVPRIVGPALLLVLVLLLMPLMRRPPAGWKGAFASAAVAFLVVGGGLYAAARSAPERVLRDLPAADFGATAQDASAEDWIAYAGTQGARHFSTLAQITPENVAGLERAWVYHTRDLPADLDKNSNGAETTPIKVGDTLYLCSAHTRKDASWRNPSGACVLCVEDRRRRARATCGRLSSWSASRSSRGRRARFTAATPPWAPST